MRIIRIWVSAVIGLLLMPCFANALVVSDPGSYARFAQQISEMQKIVKAAEDRLKQLQQIENSINGNNRYAKQMLVELNKQKRNLERLTDAMPVMDLEKVAKQNLQQAENVSKILDQIYTPKAKGVYQDVTAPLRQNYYQKALKATLENSEVTLATARDDIERIDRMTKQIDNTQNLKAASDMNNKLMAELLNGQRQIIILLAQLNRNKAAENYQGVNSKTQAEIPQKSFWQEELERQMGENINLSLYQ